MPSSSDGLDGLSITEHRAAACSAAVDICHRVRDAVAALPLSQRAQRVAAILKPPPTSSSNGGTTITTAAAATAVSAAPDAAGERAALAALAAAFSPASSVEVRLIVDAARGECVRVVAAAPRSAGDSGGETFVVEPCSSSDEDAGGAAQAQRSVVFAYLDAVDGTLLLAGLCNEAAAPAPAGGGPTVLRLAGAGGWAVGVALTDPMPPGTVVADLRVGDFTVAAVADGGGAGCGADAAAAAVGAAAGGRVPSALHPSIAVAVWADGAGGGGSDSGGGGGGSGSSRAGRYLAFDATGGCPAAAGWPRRWRLYATTCRDLAGTFAQLDAFQARDAATAAPGAAALAERLLARLGDRHGGGGAFDVLRAYGNLGALLRSFFGWRFEAGDYDGGDGGNGGGDGGETSSHTAATSGDGVWLEPQLGAFVCVNENFPNLLPAVPLVLGAGGIATDLSGAPLAARRLGEGRADVVYAGNATLHAAVAALVRRCRCEAAGALDGGGGDDA